MITYYRLSNVPSTNPPPIYEADKFRLNQLCLRSFVQAYSDVKPRMHFIADYCGREYEDLIKKEVPFEYEIEFTELGINGTALRQYELAKTVDASTILFQECDYIYNGIVGQKMVNAIEKFNLVSPYDHPDFYVKYDIHDTENKIELLDDTHYRSARRNTMTFGITKQAFLDSYVYFMKYGYLDNEVWDDIFKIGYKMHVPIPSFATHMYKEGLAPSVDWEDIWKTLT